MLYKSALRNLRETALIPATYKTSAKAEKCIIFEGIVKALTSWYIT